MENAILFGNGLNLLSNKVSWDGLLKKISNDSLLSDIPNTLKYETIILSNDSYQPKQFIDKNGDRIPDADDEKHYVIEKIVEEGDQRSNQT